MEEMSACPCLLRAPNCQALILLHVDDLLVVGDYSFIELQLLPVLKGKYKLSMELMKEPGDEVTFLKRNHVLMSKTEMVIYPHEKHFHKLFDLLKIKRSWKPKNVPSHTMINEVDSSGELGPQQASTFRSAVGVLLYMASDLVECQFTIRHLARCMASPTSRGWEILKHLVCYLLGRSEFGLLLNLEQFKYDERMKLLAYSDSDWAGHHGSRKSASSGCLMIDGILLYSSSRTQGLIALSSAEAEVYAAVSTCCDAIYMKRRLEFVFEQNVSIQLLIDKSAARQILMRAGVGRVRHLSVKILWLQQQVERKMVSVAAVASSANVADLGTKRLPCHTMRRLMYEVGVYDGSGRVANECLVNMLYFMNSGDENQVRQSFMSMGIILQKIGARTMPLGSPESEEEDREQDKEREEDKRRRYLHSSLEECSDTEYWMSLHHHYEAGDSDPMEVEEESEEEHGPPDVDWATANANQRMDYEGEVMEYRRRVVRRLNLRADRAEEVNNHEEAAGLRVEADNLDYL